jgi:hypothetical protein
MRRVLPVLAAIFAAACGYVGEPLSPLANVPAGVVDLSAIQRGNRIVVRFTVPKLTGEGMPIKGILKLDLRVGPPTEPLQDDVWAASAPPVEPASIENGTATYEIPSAPWTGKDAVLGVRVTAENGKSSRWSNLLTVPVVAPPETPADVAAMNTAQGVSLSWRATGTDFRIFRRLGNEPFARIADTPQSPWTDTSTEFGNTYVYQVQTIDKLAGDHEAESDLSQTASITPIDKFPPAVPAGARATATSNSVELSWDADTDPDLAGYRVYRAAPGAPFQKIADTSTVPAYSDHAVEPGKAYRYSVSAVDQSGNESTRSPEVAVTLE